MVAVVVVVVFLCRSIFLREKRVFFQFFFSVWDHFIFLTKKSRVSYGKRCR